MEAKSFEGCPGLVDDVMIWINEPFIKNEKSTIEVLISWVNENACNAIRYFPTNNVKTY